MSSYNKYTFAFTDTDERRVSLSIDIDDYSNPAEVVGYFHQFLTAVYGYDTKQWIEDNK